MYSFLVELLATAYSLSCHESPRLYGFVRFRNPRTYARRAAMKIWMSPYGAPPF